MHLLFGIESIEDLHFDVRIATRVRVGLHVTRPIFHEVLDAVHSFDCRFGCHVDLEYAGGALEQQGPSDTGFIRLLLVGRRGCAPPNSRNTPVGSRETVTWYDKPRVLLRPSPVSSLLRWIGSRP